MTVGVSPSFGVLLLAELERVARQRSRQIRARSISARSKRSISSAILPDIAHLRDERMIDA